MLSYTQKIDYIWDKLHKAGPAWNRPCKFEIINYLSEGWEGYHFLTQQQCDMIDMIWKELN